MPFKSVETLRLSGPSQGWSSLSISWLLPIFLLSGGLSAIVVKTGVGAGSYLGRLLPGTLHVQWLPGFAFGMAVAIAFRLSMTQFLVYATISAVTYFGATVLFILVSHGAGEVFAGAASGLTGACVLQYLTAVLGNRRITISRAIVVSFAGIVGGTWLGFFAGRTVNQWPYAWGELLSLAGFVVWQVPVGILILVGVSAGSAREHPHGSFGERLLAALDGPVAKLFAFVGSVITILSFLELLPIGP